MFYLRLLLGYDRAYTSEGSFIDAPPLIIGRYPSRLARIQHDPRAARIFDAEFIVNYIIRFLELQSSPQQQPPWPS